MTEHSPEAIAAYPYREHSNPDVYEVMKSWTDDHRDAFDAGFAVRKAADREKLAIALCKNDWADTARSFDEAVAPGHLLWERYLPEADAILASDALYDVREVQAQALEAAAAAEYRHGASSGHLVPTIVKLLRERAAQIRKGAQS